MMSTKEKYSFYVEQSALDLRDRPRKFLEAFAAVLEHSNYGLALDTYSRIGSKCNRCSVTCQLYQSTHDKTDIPCHRSQLLIKVYRRYFTKGGLFKARLYDDFYLTDAYLDKMGEAF